MIDLKSFIYEQSSDDDEEKDEWIAGLTYFF